MEGSNIYSLELKALFSGDLAILKKSPRFSEFIRICSSIPIAPGILAHSIIAVDNPKDTKDEWSDGVVAYSSAHIDGAGSELIV